MSTLPAPHEAISLTSTRHGGRVYVEYIGDTLEALRAAGCIDGDTFDLFSQTRQRLTETELGTCRRSRSYRPGQRGKLPGWRIIWIVWPSDLDRLPGCSSADVPAAVRPAPGSFEKRTEGLRVKQARPVGRRQRIAQWASCENVIWPNWQFIHGMRAEPAPAA